MRWALINDTRPSSSQTASAKKSQDNVMEGIVSEYFPSTVCEGQPTRGRGRRRSSSLPLSIMGKNTTDGGHHLNFRMHKHKQNGWV